MHSITYRPSLHTRQFFPLPHRYWPAIVASLVLGLLASVAMIAL